MSPNTQDALRDFTPAQFSLPFNMVRHKIEDGLRARMKVLKDKVNNSDVCAVFIV
jgi:hypothetical protein